MPVQARPAIVTNRKGLSGPALRTFFNIAELWKLSVDDQMILLGVTARSTFFKWKKDPNIGFPIDTLERLFYRRTFMRTYEWHISGVKIQKIYAI